MPRRTVCIQNPCRLSVKNRSLQIENAAGRAAVPLEDIWVLIVETHQATITTAALSAFSDEGIGVMTCGKDHMPNGLHLPIGAHSRHSAIVEDQLTISKPLKKQLWQRIVKAKILNQASCLDILGLPGADILRQHAAEVRSGDTTGREAVAAAAYFKRYLPDGSRRDSSYTAALDYGYAVLRGGIGRTAVAGGWLVSRGIHHNNDLNAFNLVDDLIEPFRPVVDLIVANLPDEAELNTENKSKLAALFEQQVLIGKSVYMLQTAIERQLDTLKNAVLENDASLLELPSLMG